MKKIKKSIILAFSIVLIFSSFSSKGWCSTTIDDSTYPVAEGDIYIWKCTLCDPSWDLIAGVGSYHSITIDRIYRGSFFDPHPINGGFIKYALIVDVTEERYLKGLDQHDIWEEPYYVVYNKSLHYLYLEDAISRIVPIPLNLTLIAESMESSRGISCTIDGNTISYEHDPEEFSEYTFNSNGIATTWRYIANSTTMYRFELGNGEESTIPFGNYYILISSITLICLVIIIKKRHISFKKVRK